MNAPSLRPPTAQTIEPERASPQVNTELGYLEQSLHDLFESCAALQSKLAPVLSLQMPCDPSPAGQAPTKVDPRAPLAVKLEEIRGIVFKTRELVQDTRNRVQV